MVGHGLGQDPPGTGGAPALPLQPPSELGVGRDACLALSCSQVASLPLEEQGQQQQECSQELPLATEMGD